MLQKHNPPEQLQAWNKQQIRNRLMFEEKPDLRLEISWDILHWIVLGFKLHESTWFCWDLQLIEIE